MSLRLSFRDACLAAYDKEAADLRKDLERAIDRGEVGLVEEWPMHITLLPRVIREQNK